MENRITTEEASENLKDLLGVYRPEMEESIRLGIRVLDATPEIKEIPKDYKYDTETNEFEVYRHIYTGDEIHILKEPQLYRYDEPWIAVVDRNPDKSGEYLCWISYDDEEFMSVEEFDRSKVLEQWNLMPNVKVIAWMQLPKPYRSRRTK